MRLRMSIEKQLSDGLQTIRIDMRSSLVTFVDGTGRPLTPSDVVARRTLKGVFVRLQEKDSTAAHQFSATSILAAPFRPAELAATSSVPSEERDFARAVRALQEPLQALESANPPPPPTRSARPGTPDQTVGGKPDKDVTI